MDVDGVQARHELRDRALDRGPVIGLGVGGRSGRAGGRVVEMPVELVERLCEGERHRLEAEAAPDRLRERVRHEHVQREVRRPARPRGARALTEKRLCHTLPPRRLTHVDRLDVPAAGVRPARLDHAHGPVVVLGQKDTADRHPLLQLGPLLLPRLRLEAVRLGHLGLELLPEPAQRRLVRGCRRADLHGIREPVRR